MPIYEFTCQACEKDFELLTGTVSKSEAKKCPHCGSSDISKKFSVFGFQSGGNGSGASRSSSGSGCSSCTSSSCSTCH